MISNKNFFLPEPIFQDILKYCDNRIEQRQRFYMRGVVASITVLRQLQKINESFPLTSSTAVTNFYYAYQSPVVGVNDWMPIYDEWDSPFHIIWGDSAGMEEF